jgi:hypothetical protein
MLKESSVAKSMCLFCHEAETWRCTKRDVMILQTVEMILKEESASFHEMSKFYHSDRALYLENYNE